MPRALSSAVGALLALTAILVACLAWAQAPVLETRSPQTPAPQLTQEERVQGEAHLRLEEMKVDLALLADATTFPYYIGACCEGGELELRGFVPSEKVKQRALDLASRATYLKLRDGLKIQATLSPPTTVRAPQVLQQEAAELLVKHFGESRRKIGLQARPDGQLMITGPIDSMETKLAVSRLFRQLPGCYGVLNELIVEQTLREGQRVVPVTNGSFMVPVTSLESKNSSFSSTHAAPRLETSLPNPSPTSPQVKPDMVASVRAETVNRPTLPPPPSVVKSIPDGAWEAQHTSPSTSVVTDRVPAPPSVTNGDHSTDALTAPPLPKSWQRPAMTWESALHANSASPTTPSAAQNSDYLAQPVRIAQTGSPVTPSSKLQTQSMEKSSGPISSYTAVDSTTHMPNSSPSMTWTRPSSSEESETKTNRAVLNKINPNAVRTTVSPPAQSARRWPPAYESVPATASKDRQSAAVATPTSPSPVQLTPQYERPTLVASTPPSPNNDRTSAFMPAPPSSNDDRPSAKVTTPPAPSKAAANIAQQNGTVATPRTPNPVLPTPKNDPPTLVASKSPSPSNDRPSANATTPPARSKSNTAVIIFDDDKPAIATGQPGMISFEDESPKPVTIKGQQGSIVFETEKPKSPTPSSKGQMGSIVFEDEKPTSHTVTSAAREMPLPISVPDLQRLIRAVGGQQVKDVTVENLRDGSVNVRVKVPNNTVQDQLSGKILAIPGMLSPRIHLIMDVAAP